MSDNKQHLVEELEAVIRLLADVWPADRENLAVAGAKFEQLAEAFEKYVQLKKLVDLSWKGLLHLYQKDEYFMMVKAATMQAVNTIREYLLQDGDIGVEVFEKAYEELEKSLEGGSESADSVIELDETETSASQKEEEHSVSETEQVNPVSLDDLASFFMTVDEDFESSEQIKQLIQHINGALESVSGEAAEPLRNALEIAQNENPDAASYAKISSLIEKAIENESSDSQDASAEAEIEKENTSAESHQPEAELETETKQKDQPVSEEFIIPDEIDAALIGDFVEECSDHIQMAESALLELEESPDDNELINTIFRAFHTIKGTSAFMALDPISDFTHSVETFLSMIREGELKFDSGCADISLESIDILKKMLEVVAHSGAGDAIPIPAGYYDMISVLQAISDEGKEPSKALDELYQFSGDDAESEEEVAESAEAADETTASESSATEAEKSVRVNMDRLDRLIDMVGELVIAHSVVAQDDSIKRDSELHKKVNHATKILRELQDTSLSLRMIPLKATFQKMNRLVRDISRKSGKTVKFTTIGDETEIDRNMVDIINEPLVHMVRNSLDHGIESPEERKKAGKSETANLEISASQEGGKVVIKISDDGRGIDKDKIFKKAVEKGLIDPDKKLTEKEIFNLIFLPGFSSAEKVTDLSGRGVGMDVVRRSIQRLQGKVDVESKLGKGTVISVELPFTLAITDGMVVKAGSSRFIIPTINIDMTFRAKPDDLFTIMGNQEQVSFRGHTIPILRLHRLFDIPDAVEDPTQSTLMVIRNNNKRYALMVDEVIGQQQLVGKSINISVKMDHISGGAIMGDGRVGLILDTAALGYWSAGAA